MDITFVGQKKISYTIILVAAIVLFYGVIDVSSTWLCIEDHAGYEANPVVAYMVQLAGGNWLLGIVILKELAFCILFGFIYYGSLWRPSIRPLLLWAFLFVSVFICANNLYVWIVG